MSDQSQELVLINLNPNRGQISYEIFRQLVLSSHHPGGLALPETLKSSRHKGFQTAKLERAVVGKQKCRDCGGRSANLKIPRDFVERAIRIKHTEQLI